MPTALPKDADDRSRIVNQARYTERPRRSSRPAARCEGCQGEGWGGVQVADRTGQQVRRCSRACTGRNEGPALRSAATLRNDPSYRIGFIGESSPVARSVLVAERRKLQERRPLQSRRKLQDLRTLLGQRACRVSANCRVGFSRPVPAIGLQPVVGGELILPLPRATRLHQPASAGLETALAQFRMNCSVGPPWPTANRQRHAIGQ